MRFTPDADFRGQTTFTFAGSSGGQTSAPATITITVTGRGFPPAVTLSPSTYGPRTGVPVTFTASASDPDGGAIAGYRWFVDDAEVPGEIGVHALAELRYLVTTASACASPTTRAT